MFVAESGKEIVTTDKASFGRLRHVACFIGPHRESEGQEVEG